MFKDPGRLNRRITLRTMTRTPDGGGGFTETVVDGATVWMLMEPLEGREQIEAMQTGMKRPHRFTMRYRDDVQGSTTLAYQPKEYEDARVFDVVSIVDPDAGHRWLVILAEEIV